MAKVEKDRTCHYAPVSSAFHPVHNPTFPSNLLGNVSAITDVCFWKAAAHKWTHLLFRSYESTRFSQPSLAQGPLLRSVCHRATYHIDACWLNVGADGAQCACHDPPAVPHFGFPSRFFLPDGAEQHGGESRLSLAAIYLCSCTWLQTSFGVRCRTCRQYCHVLMTGIKRHKLHYYLCTIT